MEIYIIITQIKFGIQKEQEYLDYQSPFSHYFACWANNHNGWRKMKKTNKKRAKKRWRDAWRKEAKEYER